jgi:di/tricarboxylate transporter
LITVDIAIILGTLFIALILFLTEKLRVDMVAVLIILILIFSRILTLEEAFAGFSHPIVIAVAALFIISGGLYQTGVATMLGNYINRLGGKSEAGMIASIMIVGALLSSVMNNVAATAIMLPGVMVIAMKSRRSPSRLLIPLSYATILGGMLTLVGTHPNIIVSQMLLDVTGRPLYFFDFTLIGLTLVVLGILYMVVIGRHTLPDKPIDEKLRFSTAPEALPTIYRLEERLFELRVPKGSNLVGKTLAESELGTRYGVNILGIMRARLRRLAPKRDDQIKADDRLVIQGREADIKNLINDHGVQIRRKGNVQQEDLLSSEIGIAEVTLPPRSAYVGKKLSDILLREKYGLTVIAIWRNGRPIRAHLGEASLEFGDALLVRGPWEKIQLLKRTDEFLVLSGINEDEEPKHRERMWLSLTIMGVMLLMVITRLLPLPLAALTAAVLMILTRCLTLPDAYRSIEWRMIILIAGFIPLGNAMMQTGTIDLFVNSVLQPLGALHPYFILAAVFLLSSVLALITSNISAAILMSPVAVTAAAALAISPHMLLLAVAIGASNGFMTPVAQQANLLVMGPGNYEFKDYVKVGFGLSVVVFLGVMIFLPLYRPM